MASGSDKHPDTELQPADHPGKMPLGQEQAPPTASETPTLHQSAEHHSSPFTAAEYPAANDFHKVAGEQPKAPHTATEIGTPHGPEHPFGPVPPHTPAPQVSVDAATPTQPVSVDAGAHKEWQAINPHHAQPGLDGGAPADAATRPGIMQSPLDEVNDQYRIVPDPPQAAGFPDPPKADQPGSSTTLPYKPTFSTEHREDLRPGDTDGASASNGASTGLLPGTDFGGPHFGGAGTSHGHLPGTDFGGQNSSDLPETALSLGLDHAGAGTSFDMDHGFAHHADMGPPPTIV